MRLLMVSAILVLLLLPAQAALVSDLDNINQQIKEKQETMKKLEAQIETYKTNIRQKEKDSVSLANQLTIINSRLAQTELEIQVTQARIDELNLEIKSLDVLIKEKEEKIRQESDLISHLLKLINVSDQRGYLSVIFSSVSFSEYFNQIKNLAEVGAELGRMLRQIKADKEDLREKQAQAAKKRETMEQLKKMLEERREGLAEQRKAKDYLFIQTKSSENKFRLLLAQLRQEYSQFDAEMINLQQRLEKKLSEEDLGGGVTAFSWPIDPEKGISVYFKDPTYPFRYLFEHSGIDIRASQGTPVAAPAPGYVAWARTSRLYGNNVMLIHSNGLATLYAHLSRFNVKEDVFVKRGEIIGWSGGLPGTPGAGLSTGPHLHFEVRDNGVPVDPMGYLGR